MMDKLEPILKHKFWIIFGLTIPISCLAYYSAAGTMAQATTEQEDKLDSTLSGVPSGDTEPNETYTAGAKEINEDLEDRFDAQVQKLWEMQTERMTWPKVIVPYVPDEYRGVIDRKACYTYMRVYPSVLQRVWERVQPYVGDSRSNPAARDIVVDWPQKVLIDGLSLPHATFNMALPAESEDIWDAQEDIWLLELIFDAVVRTNEDAKFVSEAPVRQISQIMLVGGSGESSVKAEAEEEGAAGYGEYTGGTSGGMSRGGGIPQLGAPPPVAFDVAEEFGEPVPKIGEEEEEESSGASSSDSYMYDGGGTSADVELSRYIGESDPFKAAYRERGFYMSVLILQDHIPDFFAELSSSPWPIRLGRFHIGPNQHASKGGGSSMGTVGSSSYGTSYGGTSGYGSFGGSFGGSRFGGGSYGDSGAGSGGIKLPAYMAMPGNIDPSLRANPDLVQVDFCGIITMYNPVTDASVEIVSDGSTEEDFTETLEASPETPEEAAAMAAEEEAANPPATPEEAPSADGETPPADKADNESSETPTENPSP